MAELGFIMPPAAPKTLNSRTFAAPPDGIQGLSAIEQEKPHETFLSQVNDQNTMLLKLLPKALRPSKAAKDAVRRTLEALDCIRPAGFPVNDPFIGPAWYLIQAHREDGIPISAGGIAEAVTQLELLLQITPEMKTHLDTLQWGQGRPAAFTKTFHFMDARLSALDSIAVDHEYYDRLTTPPHQPDPRQDQHRDQDDGEDQPIIQRERRNTNQVTWSDDLQQQDRPNRSAGSSSAMAIDIDQYQVPNRNQGFQDSVLSILDDLASSKGGPAAGDHKRYLKTRYQRALQDLSPLSLSRQLAHLLLEVNYNAIMPMDYHFKTPYDYMNSYRGTITSLQRLQNTLIRQMADMQVSAAVGQVLSFTMAQQNRGTPWSVTKLRLLQRFDLYCHDLDLTHLTRASDSEEDRAFEIAGPTTVTGVASHTQPTTTNKTTRTAWQQQQRQGLDKQAPPTKKPHLEELPPSEQCKYHLALWAKTNQTNKKCTHTFADCTAFQKLSPAAQQAFLQSSTLPPGKQ